MSLAVYEHHTEIAMLLVHRGAEVNIVEEVNASGNHACTAVSNHITTANLCSLQDGNSPLTHACVENNVELVKLFGDYNANINHQGKVSCEAMTG